EDLRLDLTYVAPQISRDKTFHELRVALPHQTAVGATLGAVTDVRDEHRIGHAGVALAQLREQFFFARPAGFFLRNAPAVVVGDLPRPLGADVLGDHRRDEIRMLAGKHLRDATAR